jgi:enoyl-CoA hydratase/carnithine racemase
VSVYQLVRHVGKGLATRMVMLGTALTAVDMQHLGMVVDVVERDELREAALTLGRGCAIPFAAVCQGGDRTHRAIATRARSARERGRDAGLPHGGGAPRLCRTILAAHGLTHAQQCIKRASNCSTVAIGAPKAAA